jgi:Uma2 family endonuclease
MAIGYPESMDQLFSDLGNVPVSRVIMEPAPGTATKQDWIEICQNQRRLCELVDGTLVEKPMGWLESFIGAILIQWLRNYLENENLGIVTGADGFSELYSGVVRGPDVAFISWERLPDGKIPTSPVPTIVPNFVIEVLSLSNTYGEMSRKRREYFQAGVELAWFVDPRNRTIAAYHSSTKYRLIREGEMIDAAPVLPDWRFNTDELFSKLDQEKPN